MIRSPDIVVSIERGIASVNVRRKELLAEIRDYDIARLNGSHPAYWIDSTGRPCARTYVAGTTSSSLAQSSGRHLARFADDLGYHTSLKTSVKLSSDAEGMHVLHIKGVDFFFYADGSGYDGWGRAMSSPGGGQT